MLDSSKLKQKFYAYFQMDDLFYAIEYSRVHFAKHLTGQSRVVICTKLLQTSIPATVGNVT